MRGGLRRGLTGVRILPQWVAQGILNTKGDVTMATALADKLEEILSEAADEAAGNIDYDKHIANAVESYDFDDAIKDTVRNYDFDDAIRKAAEDFDFSDAIEDAAEKAVEKEVEDLDLEEKVNTHLDSVLPGKVKAVFLGLLEDSDFLAKLTTALFTPWGD